MSSTSLDTEFSSHLRKLSDEDLGWFFQVTTWFTHRYAAGYEIDGTIYLVLDNSLIQDFKHRFSHHRRGINALAYTAFCRFVSGWSDRTTHLAVTAVALYEHLGRRCVDTVPQAEEAIANLQYLFKDTRLQLVPIGFRNARELVDALQRIVEDDRYLTDYVSTIDQTPWQVDLKAPLGVKIPMSIATEQIPDDLPLRYFDPWYVKFTLSARIEQFIIKQSSHNPNAKPIGSGELSIALSDLNEITRRGMLKGLGDIDLLQVCDVCRQYTQQAGYVLLGQTLDRGLAEVLSRRHVYQVGAGVEGGHPDQKQQIENMLQLMFSKPFSQEEARSNEIRPKAESFLEELSKVCTSTRGTA